MHIQLVIFFIEIYYLLEICYSKLYMSRIKQLLIYFKGFKAINNLYFINYLILIFYN